VLRVYPLADISLCADYALAHVACGFGKEPWVPGWELRDVTHLWEHRQNRRKWIFDLTFREENTTTKVYSARKFSWE